jgi:hypothetical protein
MKALIICGGNELEGKGKGDHALPHHPSKEIHWIVFRTNIVAPRASVRRRNGFPQSSSM